MVVAIGLIVLLLLLLWSMRTLYFFFYSVEDGRYVDRITAVKMFGVVFISIMGIIIIIKELVVFK